eukprot:TRINITY_DN13392_c0_g1_i1.p1 TRINITY_DN13392_c0_g1~~TRINITY_DN13392_c0_g1_i1.p1  ORF type:complete len:401 (-),score=57.03 TRINITY_DN13392_c0_g1_i1:220-1395(-)
MDVCRTTRSDGTLSLDVVRAGHFSSHSSAVADTYPAARPVHGWGPDHPLGLAAFGVRAGAPPAGRTGRTPRGHVAEWVDARGGDGVWSHKKSGSGGCWWQALHRVLGEGVPVVLLMAYDDEDHGGHYRLAIGYDAATNATLLLDPWDRGVGVHRQPQQVRYEVDKMCRLWNKTESNGPEGPYPPFFGAVLAPWRVSLSYRHVQPPTAAYSAVPSVDEPAANGKDSIHTGRVIGSLGAAVSMGSSGRRRHTSLIEVRGIITYTCPIPHFPANQSIASGALAELGLPAFMAPHSSTSSLVLPLGEMRPGETRSISWLVEVDQELQKGAVAATSAAALAHTQEKKLALESVLSLSAFGWVSGSLPPYYHSNGSLAFPAYSYRDRIGGRAALRYY